MQESRVHSLGQEDPLEKGMETHSSILAWRIPWSEEPGGLQSMGSQSVRQYWAANVYYPSFSIKVSPERNLRWLCDSSPLFSFISKLSPVYPVFQYIKTVTSNIFSSFIIFHWERVSPVAFTFIYCCCCSVAKLCLTLPDPVDCSTNSCPLCEWCHPTISSHPLSSPSPPTFNLSQHHGLFCWAGSYQVAKVLEFQLQHQSFQWIFMIDFLWDCLVWSPCSPRDSQEFSPTPQFSLQSKGLSKVFSNTTAFSLLYGPTLTSIHDYWKNHSFDCTELCRQSNISAL